MNTPHARRRPACNLLLVVMATAACCLTSTGCGSSAATAALATLVGVGVGVPLATRSHVEVEISVFNEGKFPGEIETFSDPKSPLLQQLRDCDAARARPAAESAYALILNAGPKIARMEKYSKSLPGTRVQPVVSSARQKYDVMQETSAAVAAAPSRQGLRVLSRQLRGLEADALNAAATLKDQTTPTGEGQVRAAMISELQSAKNDLDKLKYVLSSANAGPLANEVTQVVLSKGPMLDAITADDVKDRWKPFSKASSEGGTGDHHAVIYLEHMGLPVLKSSQFDPDRFVEAFGKVYQVAFCAAAAAYGVPLSGKKSGDSTDTSSGGGGLNGLDLTSSELRRKTAEQKTAKARAHLLAAIDELAKSYDADVKPLAAPLTADQATNLQKKLNDLAAKLENLDAK